MMICRTVIAIHCPAEHTIRLHLIRCTLTCHLPVNLRTTLHPMAIIASRSRSGCLHRLLRLQSRHSSLLRFFFRCHRLLLRLFLRCHRLLLRLFLWCYRLLLRLFFYLFRFRYLILRFHFFRHRRFLLRLPVLRNIRLRLCHRIVSCLHTIWCVIIEIHVRISTHFADCTIIVAKIATNNTPLHLTAPPIFLSALHKPQEPGLSFSGLSTQALKRIPAIHPSGSAHRIRFAACPYLYHKYIACPYSRKGRV